MAGIREVAALALAVSEVVEDEIPFESNDNELEGLALLFLETERIPASRTTGYVEDVVPNLTATMFKRNFRMSRDTFHWLLHAFCNGFPYAFVFEVHVGKFMFMFVIQRNQSFPSTA